MYLYISIYTTHTYTYYDLNDFAHINGRSMYAFGLKCTVSRSSKGCAKGFTIFDMDVYIYISCM